MRKLVTVLLVLYLLVKLSLFLAPSPALPQTAIVIYRYHTIEYHNVAGTLAITQVLVDSAYYPAIACDGYAQDENGHNCILAGADTISSFLIAIGYHSLVLGV